MDVTAARLQTCSRLAADWIRMAANSENIAYWCIYMNLYVFYGTYKTNYMLPHGRPEQSVPAPGGHKCLCAKVHANCVWHLVLPSRPCETRWCSPGDGLNESHIHNAVVHSKHCAVPMFAFRLARPKAIAIYTRLQQDQQISCQWLAHLKISRLSW